MRTLYIDGFAGVSGDMLVGALLDLGADFSFLQQSLQSLPLSDYTISADKIIKQGISATKFKVKLTKTESSHRHFSDIERLINNSDFSSVAKAQILKVFWNLAAAEATVHGTTPQKIHFHEVGAIDSIVDITSTILCLEQLQVSHIFCSPLPLGSGMVKCAHGTIPVPAPATLELLKGLPIATTVIAGEAVTPTGAALVATLASEFGPLSLKEYSAIGYGAGERDGDIPNVLRLVLGSASAPTVSAASMPDPSLCELFQQEVITVLTCTVDDMNPEIYDYVLSRLFSEGAHDAFLTPVQMKKNRPGVQVTVLSAAEMVPKMVEVLLTETSSLGVRVRAETRFILERELVTVQLYFGDVRIKLGKDRNGRTLNIAPEWEDCRRLAERQSLPAKQVYDLAKSLAAELFYK